MAVIHGRRNTNRNLILPKHDTGQILHAKRLQQIHGLLVNLNAININGGFIRHEVHAALALLLLQLQRYAAYGPLLDSLHQMSRKPSYLVAEALRGDDGHLFQNLLVGMEVQSHLRVVPLDYLPGGFLHRLCANTTHILGAAGTTRGGGRGHLLRHFLSLQALESTLEGGTPLISLGFSLLCPEMEMERVTELTMDRRPRKRPRLGWDVLPQAPKAQLGLFTAQEIGNVTSYAPSRAPPDHSSNLFVKSLAQNGSPPWREDDKDGHYMFETGENLTSRYKIHSKMGEGTFGQVLECWDRETKEMVAIKIVRGIKKYREAAMIEIEVLQQLGRHDKGGGRCVQIRNWFEYRNHICIVFEKLGPSLYDFLRKNNYRSFPIDLVREIGRQLLECVAFMHDLHLIHTDLKPENILLVSSEYLKVPDKVLSRSPKDSSCYKRIPKSSAIKVIDFGSTAYDRQDQSYIVSTRHYRAPEVILGLGWRYPCDIWSVGCILVELCSGEALFQTHENLEHLAMMERVLGPLPQHMLKKADRHAEKYVRRGRLDWPEGAASRDSIKAVLKLPRLQNIIMLHVDHSAGDLIHLLQGLLKYDPAERMSAREALRHPFFTRDHLRRCGKICG